MEFRKIRKKVKQGLYEYSRHADVERENDDLTFHQIEEALLNGKILEQYQDTGRGESCLIVGFADDLPIHIVCGYRGDKVVIITVYIPKMPKFIDPYTRG